MGRRSLIVGLVLFLLVNSAVLYFRLTQIPADRVGQKTVPPILTAHQKRVNEKIEEVRTISEEDLSTKLDDEWVTVNSGVYGGGVTVDSGYDFALVLGCRVRRRFVQEWDKKPGKQRQAKEIYDQWFKRQQECYEERLNWIKDPSIARNQFPVEGTKLAICTALFCNARWNSARETLDLLKQSRAFSKKIADRLPSITDDEVILELMPQSILPDASFQISVLSYAAKRDTATNRNVVSDIESLLNDKIREGLVERFDLPWQAWDCSVDVFDAGAPANTIHGKVAPPLNGEVITWYKIQTHNKAKIASIVESVESLIP